MPAMRSAMPRRILAVLALVLLPSFFVMALQSGVGGGGQSNVSGGAGSGTNPPGTTGPLPEFANYTLYLNGTTINARNNSTGLIDFSGTDAAVVINSTLANISSTGGTLYFKNGVYNLNSATQETNSGCTNFYSIGIPNNAVVGWVQFHFEGESRTSWPGELLPASINTSGVIFNLTAAAITAAGSSQLFAIWQRPNNIGSSCTMASSLSPSPFSNEL